MSLSVTSLDNTRCSTAMNQVTMWEGRRKGKEGVRKRDRERGGRERMMPSRPVTSQYSMASQRRKGPGGLQRVNSQEKATTRAGRCRTRSKRRPVPKLPSQTSISNAIIRLGMSQVRANTKTVQDPETEQAQSAERHRQCLCSARPGHRLLRRSKLMKI